jgi:hypothetical protein
MRPLFAFLLICQSLAFGQFKAANITGPDSVPAGTLVRLSATSETASTMIWVMTSDVVYDVVEPKTGGSNLYFSSPTPGVFEPVLVVVTVTIDAKPIVTLEKKRVQVVGAVPPVPPVPPIPPPGPPTPTPPAPPGPDTPTLGLKELATFAPTENRSAIKANFEAIVKGINDKTLDTPQKIVQATAAANRAIVGVTTDVTHPWNPYFSALSSQLLKLRTSGRLTSIPDYLAAWTEIASSL